MDNTIKYIAGFLLGSAFGLTAGLLLAPTTGKQARKKISKKSMKLARKMAGYVGMEDKIPGAAAKRKSSKASLGV